MEMTREGLLSARWCEEEDLARAREIIAKAGSVETVVAFLQLPFRIHLPTKWYRLEHPQKPDSFAYFRPVGTGTNTLEEGASTHSLKIARAEGFGGIARTYNAWLPGDQYGLFVRTQVLISIRLWGFWAEKYPAYLDAIEVRPREMLHPRTIIDEETNHPWTAEYFESRLVRRMRVFSWELLNMWLPSYRVSCLAPEARQLSAIDRYFLMDKKARLIPAGTGSSEIERRLRRFDVDLDGERRNATKLARRLGSRPVATIYEEYLVNALLQVDLGYPELAFVQTVMTVEWFFNEITSDRLVRPICDRLTDDSDKIRDFVREKTIFSNRAPLGKRVKTYLEVLNLSLPKGEVWSEFLSVIEKRNQLVHRLFKCEVTKDEARSAVACGLAVIDAVMLQLVREEV